MARALSLEQARRHFAEEMRVVSHVGSERLVEAFARVPRERFAGPGPWRIYHPSDGYWTTPDAEPHWLYHNVLIALDEVRRLNIGSPSLWAFFFDRIGVQPGYRVLQVGAGSGYYSAILAELVGPAGHVDAIEIDAPLAATARQNLDAWSCVRLHAADANQPLPGAWDLVIGFAGITEPAAWWLDNLTEGGRLLMPMTSAQRGGFMLRVDRRGGSLEARSLGPIGFYPCVGGRTTSSEEALAKALSDPAGEHALRSLRRDVHDRDESCWLHGEGWCLSKRELN